MYGSAIFLSRVALHAQTSIDAPTERWLPLSEWWKRSANEELRALVLAHSGEMATDVAELAAWEPPKAPLGGTGFGVLYEMLAYVYMSARTRVEIRSVAPGPIGGDRHPGFYLVWEGKRRRLEIRERAAPFLLAPNRLALSIPLGGKDKPGLLDNALPSHGPTDAWELFALRTLLQMLHEGKDETVLLLTHELGRPVWDQLLEELTVRPMKLSAPREWAFCLSQTHRRDELEVGIYSRPSTRLTGRAPKWKKASFEALYSEECTEIERDIARIGVAALDTAAYARLKLGTPQGHELLRVLSRHPRVSFGLEDKPDPDEDPSARIAVGTLTMRLEPDARGVLTPRFLVDEMAVVVKTLTAGSSAIRAGIHGVTVASAIVPGVLRPWLDAAQTNSEMSFHPTLCRFCSKNDASRTSEPSGFFP